MHEISPVLAGTFDAADYTPAARNFNLPADNATSDTSTIDGSSSTSKVDDRRGTKFDRSSIDFGPTQEMSFGDFLDMINPLEHIPVVSSIYRAATNESINPVSRVTGDIIYGGLFGVASAVIGGLGAASDCVTEAETGKDTTGYILASLFGNETIDATQIASNQTPGIDGSTPAPVSSLSDPKTSSDLETLAALTGTQAPNQGQSITASAVPVTPASISALSAPTSTSIATAQALPINQGKSFAFDPKKMPFGGVMAPVSVNDAQNMAMAMAHDPNLTRMGSTIYTNPALAGRRAVPPMAPKAVADTTSTIGVITESQASSSQPVTSANVPQITTDDGLMGAHKNPIPQNLIDDIVMMKALNQYKGIATGPAAVGSTLNITN